MEKFKLHIDVELELDEEALDGSMKFVTMVKEGHAVVNKATLSAEHEETGEIVIDGLDIKEIFDKMA